MESWYLLYCKRGQLERAKEHLTRQEIPCFTPMITLEKIVRGKRTQVKEPMFPNYMFIKLDPERIHTTTVQSTRGVSHFVRFGSLPATIPFKVIKQLMTAPPLSSLILIRQRPATPLSSPAAHLKVLKPFTAKPMAKNALFYCLTCLINRFSKALKTQISKSVK